MGEASMRWSSDETITPVARANLRMHITNKHPFNTILLPLEDSVIWNTGKWLVDGRVVFSLEDQTPWVHSHRSFLKGEWAFAASPVWSPSDVGWCLARRRRLWSMSRGQTPRWSIQKPGSRIGMKRGTTEWARCTAILGTSGRETTTPSLPSTVFAMSLQT